MRRGTTLPHGFLLSGVAHMLLRAAICQANGPEIGFDAGTIFPIKSRSIQLVSEKVEIDLRPSNFATASTPIQGPNATCEYVLRNLTRSSQTFSMAFVSRTATGEWGEGLNSLYAENLFEVEQDGQSRQVRFLPARGKEFQIEFGTEEMVFPTWSLVIGPSATSVIRMRYNASWSGGSEGESSGNGFTYHARPAARWAKRVEHAAFALHLGDSAFVRRLQRKGAPWDVHVKPAGYQWTREGLKWEFSDWEPDSDLRLWFNYSTSDPSWNPWTPDSLAAMPQVTMNLDRAPVLRDHQVCRDERRGYASGKWAALTIKLRVLVTKAGTVDEIRFRERPESDAMLDETRSCVRHWYFEPAIRAGRPIEAWTDVDVNYPALN